MSARSPNAVRVGLYRPDLHRAAVYSIWERCFGERWPLTLQIFREITEATLSDVETHQLVATDDSGRILAYIGSQLHPRKDTDTQKHTQRKRGVDESSLSVLS
jgi:hypothetical protein